MRVCSMGMLARLHSSSYHHRRMHTSDRSRSRSSRSDELVQVKRRELFPRRMPLTLSTRMSNIQYYPDLHEQCTTVTWPKKNQDLGRALVSKTCPHRPQAFEKVNHGQAFPQENISFFDFFFLNEPIACTLKHACTRFRANVRRSDCVGPILCHIYRPKLILC